MQIRLDHLTKKYGDTVAVNDLSMTIEDGNWLRCLAVRLREIYGAEYAFRIYPVTSDESV